MKAKPGKPHSERVVPVAVRRALRTNGDYIATWRKVRGLTQVQLADRAGVSEGLVVRLEAGAGGVTVENLFRVFRALGTLDLVVESYDPLGSDVGRLRADQGLPQRVRPRDLTSDSDG